MNRNGKLLAFTLFLGLSSFAQNHETKFIQKILDLPEHAEVPVYLFKKYSSEKIAESIVERIRERDVLSSADEANFDFKNDTQILLQFDEKFISAIQKNCFLNIHQTGHGKGANEPEMRAQVENENAGLKLENTYLPGLENIINELRPKYAYVQLSKLIPGLSQSTFWESYGNIFAVFKDQIKQRSTFTAGDSFGNTALHGQAHSFDWHGPKSDRAEPYWEAQIWGKLCFNDVDYFLVNCPNMKTVTQGGLTRLRSAGKPVLKCKRNGFGALVPANLE